MICFYTDDKIINNTYKLINTTIIIISNMYYILGWGDGDDLLSTLYVGT